MCTEEARRQVIVCVCVCVCACVCVCVFMCSGGQRWNYLQDRKDAVLALHPNGDTANIVHLQQILYV